MDEPEGRVRFARFGLGEELEGGGEELLGLRCRRWMGQLCVLHKGHGCGGLTSRSNSSGPASGRSRAGRTSMPGASTVDGGTATDSLSAESIALWAGRWNAQFLMRAVC